MKHRACHCCGQIHRLPELDAGQRAVCIRCHSTVNTSRANPAASHTAAATAAAFVLFWPAVLCPILRTEKLVHRTESGILGGTLELITSGNWLVGGIVLLFSIVFPLVKIGLLLELSLLELMHPRHRAVTLRIMEHVGRWSMMDVMLLAFMVMLVKLGNLVEFRFGPAVIAFILCVCMSMIASVSFDPHSIWEEDA